MLFDSGRRSPRDDATKRPGNVQWPKYRCFNRLSMCLSVSVFCAICPGASSSLAGFGSSFGTAEDSRAREPSRLHVHTPAYRRESGTKQFTRPGGRRSALDEIRSGDGNPVLYDGGRRCGLPARTGGASLSPRARVALSAVTTTDLPQGLVRSKHYIPPSGAFQHHPSSCGCNIHCTRRVPKCSSDLLGRACSHSRSSPAPSRFVAPVLRRLRCPFRSLTHS